MTHYIEVGALQVAAPLLKFINESVLDNAPIKTDSFWEDFEAFLVSQSPKNTDLLKERERLQNQLDEWNVENGSKGIWDGDYADFLREIGYIVDAPEPFKITTTGIDKEIALKPGPQLVVPVSNARYAINAVNARWGSLYDALYGSDVIGMDDGSETGTEYNPNRGARVIAFSKSFLDGAIPLSEGFHKDVSRYGLDQAGLFAILADGDQVRLLSPNQLVGYLGETNEPSSLLFTNNDLGIEIRINRDNEIGQADPAGVSDVFLEAAVTTIIDCEDSVAAVDADDKVHVYKNWLGLMRGDLSERLTKHGKQFTRTLNSDRYFKTLDGQTLRVSARSLMLVRNVGLLMTNEAVLLPDGSPVPEGLLDLVVTTLCALITPENSRKNSECGSVYIVKPKLHGPQEVQYTVECFCMVEDMLGLSRNTIKLGIMDEERRTSMNLASCVHAAKERVVFINTGFLDRTGDEIHTAMHAGAMIPKTEMKNTEWLQAYESRNVAVGLESGFFERAQIGKGMWAMPDELAAMFEEKVSHPQAGASTAWAPSPTAATIHALHYHRVDVKERQHEISKQKCTPVEAMFKAPLLGDRSLSPKEIQRDLENSLQGILGYVARWVEQGIGCSKVPDIDGIGLMEDRATLRISAQHVANWLMHGICSQAQVVSSMKKMAAVVDAQNANDPLYSPMAPDYEKSHAFLAAIDLVISGPSQPSGYTEPILHQRRADFKRGKAPLPVNLTI